MNRGYRWCSFIPKNNQGLLLYLRRYKLQPKAQAYILRDDTNADAPLYAYFNL